MGTSLWLVPQSSAATTLQNVITSLSNVHSSPSFPPHVTLASLPTCVTAPEILSCLSSQEQVLLAFEQVRTGPTFYQSVFIAIQPSSHLLQLHQHVHKTLGVQAKSPEYPHLSLYYGDEGKDEIVQKLRQEGIIHSIENSDIITVAGIQGFVAMEIWVVDCSGRPEEWSIIDKISLKPG